MLKHVVVIAVYGVVALASFGPAAADSSQCYSIQDRDRKHYCLALAEADDTACYQINDRDLKNLCLAQTRNESAACYQIQDRDTKNMCLSNF